MWIIKKILYQISIILLLLLEMNGIMFEKFIISSKTTLTDCTNYSVILPLWILMG